MKYNPWFLCPTCGRSPVDPSFELMTPAMQLFRLDRWDESLAKSGGVLAEGNYECINGHKWRTPLPAKD